MARISLHQINIGPRTVLGRRGCKLESGKSPYTNEYYQGTPFEEYFKTLNLFKWHPIRKFFIENFPDILSACRKCYLGHYKELKVIDKVMIEKLQEFKIIDECNKLLCDIEKFGSLFECIVGYALHDCQIQSIREAKIKYPFPEKSYDPDGQLYDILAALDISKLMWIECKKPLYLSKEKPLGQVISKDNIAKFIKRANFLKPDIAIYLVDTKEDYKDEIIKLIDTNYLTSGNYIDYFEDSDNIIARLNNFIYFNRVNYKSNNLFFEGIKNSINQVLYDAQHVSGFSGNHNILK